MGDGRRSAVTFRLSMTLNQAGPDVRHWLRTCTVATVLQRFLGLDKDPSFQPPVSLPPSHDFLFNGFREFGPRAAHLRFVIPFLLDPPPTSSSLFTPPFSAHRLTSQTKHALLARVTVEAEAAVRATSVNNGGRSYGSGGHQRCALG